MIGVIYETESSVEGDLPPILWFTGEPKDFVSLIQYLYPLSQDNNVILHINNVEVIKVVDKTKIVFESVKDGRTILKKDNNVIKVQLDKSLWFRIIKEVLNVSFNCSHQYIDADLYKDLIRKEEFIEEGSFIISSDYQLIK